MLFQLFLHHSIILLMANATKVKGSLQLISLDIHDVQSNNHLTTKYVTLCIHPRWVKPVFDPHTAAKLILTTQCCYHR